MIVSQLLTGLGLAGSAGLNAYVPLLAISLLGRFELITLREPFDVLTHPVVIVVTAALLVVELLVDKIPAVDHLNDVIQTLVRPAAGALVFAAGSGAITDVPAPALLAAGLVTAFSVHATKALARPVVHTATLGTGGPVVSLAEDLASVVGSLLALFAPLLAVLFFTLLGFGAYKAVAGLRRTVLRASS